MSITSTTSPRTACSTPSSRTCGRRALRSSCRPIQCTMPASCRSSRAPMTSAPAATLPRLRWAPMPLSVGFGFTKLVVHDLDAAAAFYCKAYDLHAVRRVRGEVIAGEEIEEIMLSADPEATFGSLVLLKYLRRPPSPTGELLLGFVTDDLPALLERVCAAGGRVHA